MSNTIKFYSLREEVASAIIHGIGSVLGIAALSVMVTLSAIHANAWAVVSTAIFGTSIIVLYVASTVYHAIQKPETKKKLKKFDHIAIYYLIAGTYTPFVLVNLRTSLGISILSIVWALAILGTVLKLCLNPSGTKKWSVILYLAMGWLVIVMSKALFENMNFLGTLFLIIGGLCYTLGVIFYVWKSKEFTHAIWHLMVLAGTIMHFFSVLYACVLQNF